MIFLPMPFLWIIHSKICDCIYVLICNNFMFSYPKKNHICMFHEWIDCKFKSFWKIIPNFESCNISCSWTFLLHGDFICFHGLLISFFNLESTISQILTGHKENAEFALAMCPTEPFVLSGGWMIVLLCRLLNSIMLFLDRARP